MSKKHNPSPSIPGRSIPARSIDNGGTQADAGGGKKSISKGKTLVWPKMTQEQIKYFAGLSKKVAKENELKARQRRRRRKPTSPAFTPLGGWNKFHGEDLEPVLDSGAIALLSARWLVDFATTKDSNSSNNNSTNNNNNNLPAIKIISRRQDLPPEAFLSCDDVIEATTLKADLPVIVVSHMWLSPSHPDPKGSTLKRLAHWCQLLMKDNNNNNQKDFGVFWDYCSLYQHPDIENGLKRSDEEESLFREGLGALGMLFSHQYVICFKVTQFPDDDDDDGDSGGSYPDGYNLPEGANSAPYNDRGWTFVESCWASMTKNKGKTYDICLDKYDKYNQGVKTRLAPLSPQSMEKILQEKTFTNGMVDRPLVLNL